MKLTKEESQAFVNAVIMEWSDNREPNRYWFVFKGILYKRKTMYWQTAADMWNSGDGGFAPLFLLFAWPYYLIRKTLFGSRYTVQQAKDQGPEHTLTRGASRQLWKFLKRKTREWKNEADARARARQRGEITNMLGELGFNVKGRE